MAGYVIMETDAKDPAAHIILTKHKYFVSSRESIKVWTYFWQKNFDPNKSGTWTTHQKWVPRPYQNSCRISNIKPIKTQFFNPIVLLRHVNTSVWWEKKTHKRTRLRKTAQSNYCDKAAAVFIATHKPYQNRLSVYIGNAIFSVIFWNGDLLGEH